MTLTRFSSLPLCAVLVLALAILAGCDTVDPGLDTGGASIDSIETTAPGATSKFRHSHLLDRAQRVGEAARGGTPDDYVGLIVGLDKYRILSRYGDIDPYRILSRYTDLDEYRILSRYEYEDVFVGFAIWVNQEDVSPLLADMEGDDEIQWIEPDVSVRAMPLGIADVTDEGVEVTPWGMTRIGAEGLSGAGVDLFVVDTGINSTDVFTGSGYDFVLNGSDSKIDEDGHGTHIAGTIAAKKNSEGVVGIAEGAKVHDLRVLTGNEVDDGGAVDLSRAIAAVEHVTGYKLQNPNKPVVVNFSLGADVGTTAYNALDEAIVASSAAGVTYVIAAGNSGIDARTVTPAHVAEAITVGAYGPDDRFASFSNHGSVVDVLAPGVDILSLASGSTNLALMSGTSMAAAHVSGAAAVFLAANPNASAEQVAAALVGSAQDGIAGAPRGTTAASVFLGGATDTRIPSFFQYALAAGDDINFRVSTFVGIEDGSTRNANVFANDRIDIETSNGVSVEGFGYYSGEVRGDHSGFEPRLNPTNLPATSPQPLLDIPVIDFAGYENAAHVVYNELELDGTFQLGTQDNPVIVYVRGDLVVDAASHIVGYGLIVVEDDVFIRAPLTTDGAAVGGETGVAIYAKQRIVFGSDDINAAALFYGGGEVTFSDEATIYGTVASSKDVDIEASGVSINYRPVSQAIIDLL